MEKKRRLKQVFWVSVFIIVTLVCVFVIPRNFYAKRRLIRDLYPGPSDEAMEFTSNSELDSNFEDTCRDGLSPETAYLFDGLYFNSYQEINIPSQTYYHEAAIKLENTNRHVLFQDCTFISMWYAIEILNSRNVVIENCTFLNCLSPLTIYDSDDIIFQNNYVNDFDRLFCQYSSSIDIVNNHFEGGDWFYFRDLEFSEVSGNAFSHSKITLSSSHFNTIHSNNFTYTTLSISDSPINQIAQTNLFHSYGALVYRNIDNIEVKNQNVGYTFLENCNNFTITNCTVFAPVSVTDSSNISVNSCVFNNTYLKQNCLNFENCDEINIESCEMFDGLTSIYIRDSLNTTVNNCEITNMSRFIYIYESNKTAISNCTFKDLQTTITMTANSANATVVNNTFIDSGWADWVNSSAITFENNTSDSRPSVSVRYEDQSNFSVSPGADYYTIYNCTNFTISDQEFSNISGFSIVSSNNFRILNCSFDKLPSGVYISTCLDFEVESVNITNCDGYGLKIRNSEMFKIKMLNCSLNLKSGIFILSCEKVTISQAFFTKNANGIMIVYTDYCSLEQLVCKDNDYAGILLMKSDHISIFNSSLSLNKYGINGIWSEHVDIARNSINDNSIIGIWLVLSGYNKIIGNKFKDNEFGVLQENTLNPTQSVSTLNYDVIEHIYTHNGSIITPYFTLYYRLTIYFEVPEDGGWSSTGGGGWDEEYGMFFSGRHTIMFTTLEERNISLFPEGYQ